VGSFAFVPDAKYNPFLENWITSQNSHYNSIRNHVGRLCCCVHQWLLPWNLNVLVYLYRSLGQSASLLGYCLFPINVASFVMIFVHSWLPPVMKLGMVVFAFVWASWSKNICKLGSTAFMGESVSIRKRKLALYPVILFYVFFSWFVLIVWFYRFNRLKNRW